MTWRCYWCRPTKPQRRRPHKGRDSSPGTTARGSGQPVCTAPIAVYPRAGRRHGKCSSLPNGRPRNLRQSAPRARRSASSDPVRQRRGGGGSPTLASQRLFSTHCNRLPDRWRSLPRTPATFSAAPYQKNGVLLARQILDTCWKLKEVYCDNKKMLRYLFFSDVMIFYFWTKMAHA